MKRLPISYICITSAGIALIPAAFTLLIASSYVPWYSTFTLILPSFALLKSSTIFTMASPFTPPIECQNMISTGFSAFTGSTKPANSASIRHRDSIFFIVVFFLLKIVFIEKHRQAAVFIPNLLLRLP